MKKWKRILIVLLCLLFVQTPVLSLTEPVSVEAATVKKGLKKEKGKYYYYVNGKKITNQWKTVKTTSNGKTVSYRYYFTKTGAAYAGKKVYGINTPAFKKINGVWYGFDVKGRMIKTTCVINNKFYVFNSKTGKYDAAKTKNLRKASSYGKSWASLNKLLKKYVGSPTKIKKLAACVGDGTVTAWYYPYFEVEYTRENGKEIVVGIASR